MSKSTKLTLTSNTFQFILVFIILLIISGIGAFFYFAQQMVTQKAIDTDHAKTDAIIAEKNIERLKHLSSELETHRDVVDKASEIVASSQQYQYQNQAQLMMISRSRL